MTTYPSDPGRCGAFGTTTGRVCVHENDHEGPHELEGERARYEPTDLLNFEQVVAWFDAGPRTVERMRLPWSRPTRGRMRRILFRDLLAHVERRKE